MTKREVEFFVDAWTMYDGGWRKADLEEMKKEYELSEEEAEAICKYLKTFEEEAK